MKAKLLFVFSIAVLLVLSIVPVLNGTSIASSVTNNDPGFATEVGNRPNPLGDKQAALKGQALEAQLNGNAYGKAHEGSRIKVVELAREGEDPVWTVLGEFNDLAHNSIAEPDRDFDNTTIWTANFSRDYYMDLFFSEEPGANSLRNYLIEQSSNRYAVYGDVTDWVTVPGNAASYDDHLGPLAVWQFLIDSLDGWYAAQVAAGKTPAEIDAYLSQFDVWDRYDYDYDGIFDEPDGYIDRFQSVHSGESEQRGGGALGYAAIQNHNWYANYHLKGTDGPFFNLNGGVQIGGSSFWVGDYIIQAENSGMGEFAHTFARDLGLPRLYSSGIENSTGFWTLMSSGQYLSDGTVDVGSKPGHMGAWEKFQLGWLNYEVASAGYKSQHKLGPAETNTKQAQTLFVVLPQKPVTTEIGSAHSGDYFYYSGQGNNIDNFMHQSLTLAAGSSLNAYVNFDIEVDWDYAYLVVSTDGGATWDSVETNFSTNTNPNFQNFGYGITGSSGGWDNLTADLSAYTGNVLLGFRYWTDVATVNVGFMVDDIEISGYGLDDAETGGAWTYDGFIRTTGTETAYYSHYYVAEFRQYYGFDESLRDGAYNFGFMNNATLQNWVEHFPYQDGLLISYWDTSQTDNQVASHPGYGLLLPIDAHPDVMYDAYGGIWRSRVQSYDSTFSLEPTDAITLHQWSQPSYHPSLPAVPVFDDTIQYYRSENPYGGVINPHTGTQIRVRSVSGNGNSMQVQVVPVKQK
jgi:immune inhibitor A